MLFEEKQLPEINYMKHRHDSDKDYVDYENNILKKSLSSYIFNNNRMNKFILKIQKLLSINFDQINVIKNFKNYIVDKYYYKHKN